MLHRHEWNVSPKEAVMIQQDLRDLVTVKPLKKEIKIIAGVDVSLNLFEKDVYAGIILFSFPELKILGHSVVKTCVEFPYIPGLLSFREIPPLISCIQKLKVLPDVMIVDGQGIAHPRHLGVASHLGVLTGIPTIGCAKSVLYGKYDEPKIVGEHSDLVDPKSKEKIGSVLKTKDRAKPLVLSPGHLTSHKDSLEIIRASLRGYRMPEPTRVAHLLVNAFRKGENLTEYGQEYV